MQFRVKRARNPKQAETPASEERRKQPADGAAHTFCNVACCDDSNSHHQLWALRVTSSLHDRTLTITATQEVHLALSLLADRYIGAQGG